MLVIQVVILNSITAHIKDCRKLRLRVVMAIRQDMCVFTFIAEASRRRRKRLCLQLWQ